MRFEVLQLADGWAGTNMTVAKAGQLISDSLIDPVVVTTAQNIVRYLPERDKDAQIRAISAWVRRHVKYLNEGVETLKTPRFLLDEIKEHGVGLGDCDDFTILLGALYRAVGLQVRAKVISQRKDKAGSHIYIQVLSPKRGWVTDDAIVKHKPLGWEIPSRERTKNVVYPLNGLGGASMANEFWAGGVLDAGEDWLPKPMAMFAEQSVEAAPRHHRHIKRGGALEVREDGSIDGVGALYQAGLGSFYNAGMGDILDVVGSLATKAVDIAKAKIDAKMNKALNPPAPMPPKAAGAGSLLSNPFVQVGGVLVGGFILWKVLDKAGIL